MDNRRRQAEIALPRKRDTRPYDDSGCYDRLPTSHADPVVFSQVW